MKTPEYRNNHSVLVLPLPSTSANTNSTIELNIVSLKIAIENELRQLHENAPFFNFEGAAPTSHIDNLLKTWRNLENLCLGCNVDYVRDHHFHWYKPAEADAKRAQMQAAELARRQGVSA